MSDPMSPDTALPSTQRPARDPFRWIIEHPTTVDLIIFGGASLLVLLFSLVTGTTSWWTLFSVPMIAAGPLCRTRPLLGVIIIGALAVAHVVVNVPVVIGDVMTFYAMFCAIAYGTTAAHIIGICAGLLGVLVQAVQWGITATVGEYGSPLAGLVTFGGLMVVGTISVIAVWAVANLQRARMREVALHRDRAEQAVREREQRTALAVADERARIAREMHDVVAHSLSVIIAQADGGRFVASQDPQRAREVLGTIGQTGRAALADMRSLLGVLRQEEETSFGPQPGPEMLDELVERVRSAGLPVTLERTGPLDDLPQALGLSLFRLVQESLTNVLKHAGPEAAASVRIDRTAEQLMIEVIDDGQGTDPAADGQGHGLTGMRERMSVFGGTLQASPLPSRGFRVCATVPLAPTASDQHPTPASQPAHASQPVPAPQSRPAPKPAPAPQSTPTPPIEDVIR